jgi:hypothetical protein
MHNDDIALSLSHIDLLHLLELLLGAKNAMPSNTDCDLTRACLRAAYDFLEVQENNAIAEAKREANRG